MLRLCSCCKPLSYPDVLVHVAGGGEQSATDVTLVRPHALGVRPGPAAVHEDAVYGLQVDVEVAGLRVAPTTKPALVGPLIGVSPHVPLQQGRHVELFITGGALERHTVDGEASGGGRGHAWRRGLDRAELYIEQHQHTGSQAGLCLFLTAQISGVRGGGWCVSVNTNDKIIMKL